MPDVSLSASSRLGCLLISGILLSSFSKAAVTASAFGRAGDEQVEIFTLTNAHGLQARIMTYGATIVSLKTPDRAGTLKNIVLGFDTVDNYVTGVPYYGATIGRYANRIAHAQFVLDGITHHVPINDGVNSLHGGTRGFDKRIWKAEVLDRQKNKLRLTYVSADGEEGYPGQLTARVTYHLSENDTLEIHYEGTTTALTPVNLANHSYFNLTGDSNVSILHHTLQINADAYTPVDSALIPTGEIRPVAGTPFDFRVATQIGEHIQAPDEQLMRGHGYDHNWILRKPKSGALLGLAAVLTDPESGRKVEVFTSQPGLQFYSGNFMDGKPAGAGSVYAYRTGLCLETQHFPDSPNRPSFPNSILRPGETYRQTTVFHFSTVDAQPVKRNPI